MMAGKVKTWVWIALFVVLTFVFTCMLDPLLKTVIFEKRLSEKQLTGYKMALTAQGQNKALYDSYIKPVLKSASKRTKQPTKNHRPTVNAVSSKRTPELIWFHHLRKCGGTFFSITQLLFTCKNIKVNMRYSRVE